MLCICALSVRHFVYNFYATLTEKSEVYPLLSANDALLPKLAVKSFKTHESGISGKIAGGQGHILF